MEQMIQTAPLLEETQTLFRCVAEQDYDTLANLCDDDFGIIDIAPDGGSVLIPDRPGWENWFHTLFAQLNAMQAKTWTDILQYNALRHETMAYSAVEFCQYLAVGGQTHRFFCVATIIWKKTDKGWKESRWHCSVLRREEG